MVRHSFFKTLAVTVSSFQNQSRNARPYAQPTNKSNNDVRQISASIVKSQLKSRRSRVSDADQIFSAKNSKPFGLSLDMERLVEWNLLISTIKSATNLDMEAYREAPVSRRLFAEKEASPKTKQGRSSDKPAAESTKAWVVKSFGEKPAELDRETERRNPKGAKEDNPKKSNFKTASWYRDPSVEVKKAASDPGKTTSRKSLSNDKRPS
ncbi:hypothetical protein F2Q69_00014813 [Brassica cretica]|uniref:Uncharacterized protein n=1 Tax=Brassica cretica TaxID=69181 RepID=A0A8S9QWT9_BRACR|nr:hypothetical protein F2Q69_00014813 [Brassica cretica]